MPVFLGVIARPSRYIKRAFTLPEYYRTYAVFGAGGLLSLIYFFEWKEVGQYIPVWRSQYAKD